MTSLLDYLLAFSDETLALAALWFAFLAGCAFQAGLASLIRYLQGRR